MSKKAKTEIQKISIYKFPRKFFILKDTQSAGDRKNIRIGHRANV